MRINYAKSEIFIVGLYEEEGQEVADALTVSLGRLTMAELSETDEKIQKSLQTWKCGHLSFAGRSILINNSLTSIWVFY